MRAVFFTCLVRACLASMEILILFPLDVHSKLLAAQETQSLPSKYPTFEYGLVAVALCARVGEGRCVRVKAQSAQELTTVRYRLVSGCFMTLDSIDLKTNRPRIRRL